MRSSAWIWNLSSTDSTMAWAGGSTSRPITLRDLLNSVPGLGGDGGFGDLDATADPIMSLTEMPPPPAAVVPVAFIDAMTALSLALDGLVNDNDGIAWTGSVQRPRRHLADGSHPNRQTSEPCGSNTCLIFMPD